MRKLLNILLCVMILALVGCRASQQIDRPAKARRKSKPVAIQKAPRKVDKKEFSKLELTNIVYLDGQVNVKGVTDLPDNSELTISFNVASQRPDDPYTGVDNHTKVSKGQFETNLSPPDLPVFNSGPYVVEAMFTPRAQNGAVLRLVGANGQRLSGDKSKVEEILGFKTMETSRQVDLQLSGNVYPMVSVDSYPSGSPEKAFAEFLIAWQKKDWGRMKDFTQQTWRSQDNDPQQTLESWFGGRDLLGAEIVSKTTVDESPVIIIAVDITAKLQINAIGSKVETKIIKARVIQEAAPKTPSSSGAWGVNPISMLDEQ